MVYLLDMLLRNRNFRKLLLEYSKGIEIKTDEHRVLVIKCSAYLGNVNK